MGVTNSSKEISTDRIDCGGVFQVRLSLTAEPDIQKNPTDIVMILDRSGSMAGSPLANLKNGAKKFIEILDESTDGVKDGKIGNGSHIGIVSFATIATQDTPLTTSVAELDEAVNHLSAMGSTNHADAFTKAMQLFDPASSNAKVMIMFTDGVTTAGGPPAPVAAAARAQGVIIYVIGLNGSDGIDEDALKEWASDPDSAYVVITPDDEELEKIFEDLARNITKPGATDLVITDKVDPCFKILSVESPTKGTAILLDPTTVQWKIAELGVKQSEGAALTFNVQHNGVCSGTLPVNESIEYRDKEGNQVDFDSPEIEVDCSSDVFPEDCPHPVEVTIGGCEDAVEFDAGDLNMESLGRILQVDVTVKNVCPHRRVALGVIVTELDDKDNEYKRGLKTVVIPAHNHPTCRDVTVRCLKFVLPEELDVSGRTDALCNRRKFRVRFIVHYIDNDFVCCEKRS
ncbi:MAG: VWA domain-containing protein [Candidatus Heritagella sp.]